MFTSQQLEDFARTFASEGYLTLPGIVPAQRLASLRDDLLTEFARAKRAGELFSGGGMISGHLNCFPGAQSRFVYEALEDAGVIALVRKVMPESERLPNIGCNLNLPGSSAQNFHIDGYAAAAFMTVNVAVVDTTILNGAMQATPRSQRRAYKYWEFATSGLPSLRSEMKAGDILLRPSTLWHRGMPNRSKAIRPMLGLTWEDGGSKLDDPWSVNGGKIGFFPNRYTQTFTGKLRERAFAAMPSLGSGYLFVRSLLSG
jgi:hypothetical protein